MIQVDSLVAVFILEGLVGALMLVIGVAFFMFRRRVKARKAASQFINHLNKAESSRSEILGEHISEACDLEQGEIEAVVTEVRICEKTIYQKSIQLFLNRDAEVLNGIDQSVQALSKPFCKVLSEISEQRKDDPELVAALEAAQAEVDSLRIDSDRLSKQLSMAMETMDDISSEYANMFSSSREAEELDMSRKRMLNTYRRAEESMAKIFSNQQPAEEASVEEI